MDNDFNFGKSPLLYVIVVISLKLTNNRSKLQKKINIGKFKEISYEGSLANFLTSSQELILLPSMFIE